MARTAGKDPAVMKTKKTPRGRQKKARSSGRLGQGSEQEWNVRPDKAQPNGARKTKKSRRSHSEWSDDAGVFDMRDSDDDWLPSMDGKQRESGAATPAATSAYRTRPAVKRARNDSTGGGGSQQVSAPATDDEACQPPTMSAAVTRKRKSEGGGGTSGDGTGGGRQRRNRTKRGAAAPSPAAAAAATTASTTGNTTSSGPTRLTRRTTSGGGSTGGGSTGGGGTGGGGTGISPPASTTTPSPSSTASSDDFPVTTEEVRSNIRAALPADKQAEWDRTVKGDSWTPRRRKVEPEDVKSQADISELKKTLTRREVPLHAAGVGPVVFREGVVWDTLQCKILAFPVNAQHFMGGPDEYKGKNAAVVWGNNVYWLGENGKLLDGQCCTAHYLGQVMQRCGLDRVFVCDASGVAHPRSGSALKKDHAGTRELVTEHVRYLLGSGRRILEVHSRGTTLRFLEVLEEMATAGHADVSFKIGSGNVRAHVFFGVPCGPDGKLDTVVLFGTNHHSMMRWSFVANSIIRSQIAASALAGNPLTQEQTALVWLMSTTGTLTPEEWKEHFAELIEELGEELLAKFEEYIREHDGDMDRAYQSLNGWKGGMAAPTTKAKKGGEWETALRERREEVARLGAALRTRGNAKAAGKVALEVDEISAKLEAQYRRWDLSVGAMQFGNALKYEEYLAAKKIVGDKKTSPREVAAASAVVARLDQEKAENMAANGRKGGKNSWTSLTAGKTVAGAAEEEAAAREALSAAKTRAKKATAEEALEAATADLEMVKEARQRSADGGKADYAEGAALKGGGTSKGTREGKGAGGEASIAKRKEDPENYRQECADGGKASIAKRKKDPEKFRQDSATGGKADYAEGAALKGGGTSKGTREGRRAGGKAKQGKKISSSGGKRGGGGAARKGNPDISSVRALIGRYRRAYRTKTGNVKIGGFSTFFHYRDVRTPGSQKRILGLMQHDSNGSDKTLSYPVDDKGEMVTGVWGADPTLGLNNAFLVLCAREYVVTETTTAAASAES